MHKWYHALVHKSPTESYWLHTGPALGLGHLGHGLGPPNMGRPPNMGQVIFFFLIKEKCELDIHFFSKSKILELC